MTGAPVIDWIVGVVVGLAGAFGVYAGARKALADAKALRQPPVTPYEALAERVAKLEVSDAEKAAKINKLSAQIRRLAGVLTREVQTLVSWHDEGAPPPPPEREVAVIKSVIDELTAIDSTDT